ncbi:hypothetical protein [Stenotrophomonas sp. Iso1]|uniref:hypothetical protein n=1 Tax=Stenotrophomonas sp. Iso1 TaxID=2977283 RepID=UPI0022B7C9EF|nr:hypothetical protein [Stenotrophomonas sp. Iso1]
MLTFLSPTMPDPLPLLGFANPQFHTGHNISVRRGDRWHGVVQARIDRGAGRLSAPLPLLTELRRFDTLTAADLRDEHDPACRTPEGLLAVMRRLYAGFQRDEMVTLVHFDWAETP